jgi:hypothetical protein
MNPREDDHGLAGRRPTFDDLRADYDDEFGQLSPSRESARRLVRIPAMAFIVSGPFFIFGLTIGEAALIYENLGRALAGRGNHVFSLLIGTAAVLLGLVASIMVIAGGLNMLRLRKRWLVLVAAYVTTATALMGCYAILFFPFGIWGLIVLYRPDVRREFARLPVKSQHDH